MKMLSEESSSVSSALLSVASSSKGRAQAGGAIVAARGLPLFTVASTYVQGGLLRAHWLLCSPLCAPLPASEPPADPRGWHEFAFSSAPRSRSEGSSAAPEDLRRGLGRLYWTAAGEKTRHPGKHSARAEQTKVDSAAPTRKGSHDEPWRRHGVDAQ